VPAKLSIHVPTQAVTIRVLADGDDVIVGRAPDCDCVLAHDSVSRRHARIRRSHEGGWSIEDLGSKNGIRVDGNRVTDAMLAPHQWLAIGDVFCEFERVEPDAVQHLNARAAQRRHSSQLWIDRIATSKDNVDGLMDTLLRGIVDIAECRRGFLLVTDSNGQMRMRARQDIDSTNFNDRRFSGSRSAIERSIAECRAVYLSGGQDHDGLLEKASVLAHGIRALACLPLLHETRLLGVVYADTTHDAKIFTDLDAELLEAFADRGAATLATFELHKKLNEIELSMQDSKPELLNWSELAQADPRAKRG